MAVVGSKREEAWWPESFRKQLERCFTNFRSNLISCYQSCRTPCSARLKTCFSPVGFLLLIAFTHLTVRVVKCRYAEQRVVCLFKYNRAGVAFGGGLMLKCCLWKQQINCVNCDGSLSVPVTSMKPDKRFTKCFPVHTDTLSDVGRVFMNCYANPHWGLTPTWLWKGLLKDALVKTAKRSAEVLKVWETEQLVPWLRDR